MTLINYLTQVRLQEARMLLLNTPEKVMNVALKSGFRSSIYFCRWIRKHTGMTPEEFRRAAQN